MLPALVNCDPGDETRERVTRAYCVEHDHYPDELLVSPGLDAEQMIVADNHGEPTGAWEDEVHGITAEQREWAREEDNAWCRTHMTEVEWRHDG